MAGADYRSCDVCGTKTFYDARLEYDFEEFPLHGLRLGQWKVICQRCSKTHDVIVVKREHKS